MVNFKEKFRLSDLLAPMMFEFEKHIIYIYSDSSPFPKSQWFLKKNFNWCKTSETVESSELFLLQYDKRKGFQQKIHYSYGCFFQRKEGGRKSLLCEVTLRSTVRLLTR